MEVYKLDFILNLENEDNDIDIDISDFMNKYHKVLQADKYTPVFSKTDKYKSFPGNIHKKQKNFIHNNKWKIHNSMDKNRLEIKALFNKLSLNNYDVLLINIVSELIKFDNFIDILIKELIDKIWFDDQIRLIYIRLIQDLWNNPELLKKSVKINNKDGIFSFSHNKITHGPFTSLNKLINFIKNKNNIIKNNIISFIYDEFNKRDTYLNKIEIEKNEDKLFVCKKKLFGTIQFITSLYNNNLILDSEFVLIIEKLLNKHKEREGVHTLEYECFYKVWVNVDVKKNKLLIDNFYDYLKDNPPGKTPRINILFIKILDEMENNRDIINIKYDMSFIIKILKNFRASENLEDTSNKLSKCDKTLLINELLIYQLENNNIVVLLLKMFTIDELQKHLSLIDLDELILDIPCVKDNYNLLLEKIKK